MCGGGREGGWVLIDFLLNLNWFYVFYLSFNLYSEEVDVDRSSLISELILCWVFYLSNHSFILSNYISIYLFLKGCKHILSLSELIYLIDLSNYLSIYLFIFFEGVLDVGIFSLYLELTVFVYLIIYISIYLLFIHISSWGDVSYRFLSIVKNGILFCWFLVDYISIRTVIRT